MGNMCGNCFRECLNEQRICTACGYRDFENREKYPLALAPGSILNGRYIIGRVLGQGGFGITYTAKDHQTGETVAIKEFFPDTMVTRSNHTTVTPYAGARGENFAYGKDTFLLEARTMAQFIGCPNIVRVYSYFEENGTGYFVMEYVDGQSFQSYLKNNFGRIPWDDALRILLPVMDALSLVHEKGIIHRDIAPDNICIAKDGTVKLLDFGAARYSLGNVSQSLDVVLRHGFAPREQYKRRGRQGPYTDVYALGATLYYALCGIRPDDALERQDEDNMPLPSSLGANVTEAQENVILKAMAIEPEDRYQSMAEFKAALLYSASVKKAAPKEKAEPKEKPVTKETAKPQPVKKEAAPGQGKKQLSRWVTPAIAAFLLIMGLYTELTEQDDKKPERGSESAGSSVSIRQTEPNQGIQIRPDMVIQVEEPGTDVFLMESFPEEPESDDVLKKHETYFWGQKKYLRSEVKTVRFQDTLEGAPSDAWDVSAGTGETVLAWMKDGNLTVAANGTIRLNPDSRNLFTYFKNVTEIDFGGCVETTGVTNMKGMFSNCTSLTTVDVSFFDTSQATDISSLFWACRSLKEADVSGFDTSNATSMSGIFYGCQSLTNLDVSNFDTSKIKSMMFMFYDCDQLTELDVSNFDTSNVMVFEAMFSGSKSLKKLDLSNFDVSSATKLNRMFSFCSSLEELDISGFHTDDSTQVYYMFSHCENLEKLKCSDDRILDVYKDRLE